MKIGDTVLVSDPDSGDDWIQEFVGNLIDIVDREEGQLYIVEDQDGDIFSVEYHQVKVYT